MRPIRTLLNSNTVLSSSFASAQTFYRAMHYSAYNAVLPSYVVRPSVRPSVCDVGDSGPHRLEILETNWTDN